MLAIGSVIYMAANIIAVFFLIRMGGVLPIMVSIILLLGLIVLSGAMMADLAAEAKSRIAMERKRKENLNERMGSEASGDDVSAGR